MVDATLSRGGTSVTFPVIGEAGDPLIARDFGKPEAGFRAVNDPNPRPTQDKLSGSETIRINTVIEEYGQAITLANLIKEHSGGDNLVLDVPLDEFDSNIDVFPAAGQKQALQLNYRPGRRDWIEANLSLSRVDALKTTDSGFSADTPTATGTGPITLSDGTRSVSLVNDVTVTRSVGRPNAEVSSRISDFPTVIDHRQSSYDAFEIQLSGVDNAIQTVNNLLSIFRTRRGRDTLTLDFNGLFGMGAFAVRPRGSGALRHVRQSGRDGATNQSVPAIDLRVVLDD